jgi:nitrogen fixation/metabolism regulation signal transduction histidine kinase
MGLYATQDTPSSPEGVRSVQSTKRSPRAGKAHSMAQFSSLTDRDHKLGFVQRVVGLALLGALPALVLALTLLWTGDFSGQLRWTLTLFVVLFWLGVAMVLRHHMEMPLRTLSNLISSLREGDYSFRARRSRGNDPLAEVMREANALINLLYEQRLGALEATTLLRKVMEEIDVAVFAFGDGERLQLVNRAGERLLGQPAERLRGLTASELGLERCLQGEPRRIERTLQLSFPGAQDVSGRWGISRSSFRQGGLPMELLVITDLRRALREEELQAWQRLVRVLGHEINNSLAPIKSIAESLEHLLGREPPPLDWQEDVQRGLRVISGRAEALSRFTGAYATLAKLPKPQLRPVNVAAWVRRVAAMETRVRVSMIPGPELTIRADADQLDQLLINLLRNAAEASLDIGGGVSMGWKKNGASLEVWVEDEGHGIANPGNLFVPFFTTKPRGAGIGLVLSRQIAEAHGGRLTIENRPNARGAVVRLLLPLYA